MLVRKLFMSVVVVVNAIAISTVLGQTAGEPIWRDPSLGQTQVARNGQVTPQMRMRPIDSPPFYYQNAARPPIFSQAPSSRIQRTAYQTNGFDDGQFVPRPELAPDRSVLQVQNLSMPQELQPSVNQVLPPANPGYNGQGITPNPLPQGGFAGGQENRNVQNQSGLNWGQQPRPIDNSYATVGNSPCVTAPTQYISAGDPCGCGSIIQTGGVMPYAPPQAVIVPPTVTPGMAPQAYVNQDTGYTPLISLGQENYNVQLGRGILGQPKAYVPGQYFRNFIRYLSP